MYEFIGYCESIIKRYLKTKLITFGLYIKIELLFNGSSKMSDYKLFKCTIKIYRKNIS